MDKVIYHGDKTLAVKPGQVVKTGYVSIFDCIIDCRAPMAIGDVERKYEVVKQNAPNALFPAPMGYWKDDRFHVVDGRHTYVAYLLNGYSTILVMWVE